MVKIKKKNFLINYCKATSIIYSHRKKMITEKKNTISLKIYFYMQRLEIFLLNLISKYLENLISGTR